MMTEVESMFTKFIEVIKLSTAPLKVGDPTDKVTDAISDKGEASSEKAPLLVEKMAPTSLLMWNHHSFMVDRFLPPI